MIPDPYVWLAWSCGAFLLPWLGVYLLWPRLRGAFIWISLFTLPFGLSEPLFIGNYWNPPSLFNLWVVTHFDIESFIHSLSIGGIAGVLYNIVTGQAIRVPAR